MSASLAQFRAKPVIERWATVGLALGFAMGGIGGLIRGLEVHAATAWFAVLELGIPAGLAGGLVGLCGGVIVTVGRRIKPGTTPPTA